MALKRENRKLLAVSNENIEEAGEGGILAFRNKYVMAMTDYKKY